MSKLIAMGELLIDFQSVGHQELIETKTFVKNPGGAPANVAVQVAKFNKKVTYIARVGDDAFGEFLIKTLKNENVDVSQIIKDKEHSTPLAFVSIKENGEREFNFFRKTSADLFLNSRDIDENIIEKGDILHFGTVALSTKSSREAHNKLINKSLEYGNLISFDPNLRFNLWDSDEELRKIVNKYIKFANILKISDDELPFITGESDENKAIKKLFKSKRLQLILLSRGSNGAIAFLRNKKTFTNTGYGVNAIDTTGAGDSFLGAVLSQIIEKDNLLSLDYSRILDFACKVGAYVTTKYGAISAMGNEEEIISYFKERSRL